MSLIFRKIILSILFYCCSVLLFSQNDGRSKNIQTINGKKYYLHKVEKGQSIYAISKIYNTDLNTIFIENPDAIEGIEAGQELKILVSKEKENTSTAQALQDLDKYNTHKVSKGETVFGICKKHKITEARLTELNPEVKQGLREGMELKVSLKESTKEPVKNAGIKPDKQVIANTEKTDTTYQAYIVEQGETVYSIAKKHSTTQEQLIKLNPELTSGVKTGQRLKLAKNKVLQLSGSNESMQNSVAIVEPVDKPAKQTYKVGVFLPFGLDEAELINTDQLVTDKLAFPIAQQICIDFYEGMLAALDSLNKGEVKITYELYDADDRDSTRLEKMCSDSKFKSLDLIIGPLYTSAFRTVAGFAKKHQIPIVSPVAQQNKILYENPYSSKTTPSNNTLIDGLAEFMVDSFRNENVIIINSGKNKEQGYLKTFKHRYNEYLALKYSNTKDTVPEVKGLAGAKQAYVVQKKNYFVLLSEDEVFLTDFLTQLHVFADKKEITLIGEKKWVSSDNFDPEYLNHFKFIYAAPLYIDFSSEWIKKTTNIYRTKYYTDPSDFYYEGYDVAFYYLNALKNTGPSFYKQLDKVSQKGSVINFNFFRPSNNTGFDNKSVYIIQYKDYKFQKVN